LWRGVSVLVCPIRFEQRFFIHCTRKTSALEAEDIRCTPGSLTNVVVMRDSKERRNLSNALFLHSDNRKKVGDRTETGYNYSISSHRQSMPRASSTKIKVLRLRLKDKHAKFLRNLAGEVNFVWNYCNELQDTDVQSRTPVSLRI